MHHKDVVGDKMTVETFTIISSTALCHNEEWKWEQNNNLKNNSSIMNHQWDLIMMRMDNLHQDQEVDQVHTHKGNKQM